MLIDEKLIAYLEDLSYLYLTDNEKIRIAGDMEKILEGMARLSELGTDDIPVKPQCINELRKDTVTPSFDRNLILRNAPEKNNEMFISPKVQE